MLAQRESSNGRLYSARTMFYSFRSAPSSRDQTDLGCAGCLTHQPRFDVLKWGIILHNLQLIWSQSPYSDKNLRFYRVD